MMLVTTMKMKTAKLIKLLTKIRNTVQFNLGRDPKGPTHVKTTFNCTKGKPKASLTNNSHNGSVISLYPEFGHHNRDCSWILRLEKMSHDSNSDGGWISISLDEFKRASNNHAKIEIYNLKTMELVFEIDQDLLTYKQLNFYHDIRNAFNIFSVTLSLKTKQKICSNFKAYVELSIHHTKIQSFFFDMLV